MYPSTEVYKKTVNDLLKKHYGIDLNDTIFDDEIMARSIQDGVKAWELTNAIAEDCEIGRIDTGWIQKSKIGEEEEVLLTLQENSMQMDKLHIFRFKP